MTFSAIPAEHADDGVVEAAKALAGAGAEVIPVTGGGNNRVFRVLSGQNSYALKGYPTLAGDSRDRLGVEFQSLSFLKHNGVDAVPAALASDREKGFALYEWIDGTGIDNPGDDDIDAVLGFIETLDGLADTKEAGTLPLASEACLSASEIVRQINGRFQRLTTVAGGHPELSHFLADEFLPALRTQTARAHRAYGATEGEFADEIAKTMQTLNPSDFGFHNALRKQNDQIVFLDFEYFGWDDPVKLVSDFLLHPGHALSGEAGERFFRGAEALFGKDAGFAGRLSALYPLYGLRWCLIILAEFLPERMKRRRLAGQHENPESACQGQLEKAQELLNELMTTGGDLPYGD